MKEKGYKDTEKWNGIQKFECEQCPFDSLDLDAIKEHITKAHVIPEKMPTEPVPAPPMAEKKKEETA